MDRDELNAALAVELFGWTHGQDEGLDSWWWWSPDRKPQLKCPDYLTGDGMLMVDQELLRQDYAYELHADPSEGYWVRLWKRGTDEEFTEAADTAPKALAEAALAAKRKEKAGG